MTEQQRIEATEAALRAACTEARERGLELVRETNLVRLGGVLVGCCVWGAYDTTGGAALPFRILGSQYDAIEHGWDGAREHAERDGLPMPWFDLGARLAAEFLPVAASTLEVTR